MKGLIYKIEKYTTQCGPGFRTVVYMKGTPLEYPWCEFPEAQENDIEMLFDKEKCKMCYKCTQACNQRIVAEAEHQVFECTKCGKCVEACPNGARELIGEYITPKELVDRIMPEMEYYKTSGGGVTFSGGEPLMQADFLLEVIKLLKENDVNVAIETDGYADYKVFEKLIPYTDYFLYNLDLVNDDVHKRFTGVSNELIIENLKKVSFSMSKVIVNVTFVSEVNCNMDELKLIVSLLSKLELEGIIIKGYNNTNEYMYRLLGKIREYEFKAPNRKTLLNISNLFKRICDDVKILS